MSSDIVYKSNKNKRNQPRSYIGLILGISIFLCIIVAIASLVIIRQEGTKCIADPLDYGAKQIAKQYNSDVIGTIKVLKLNSPPAYFSNNPNVTKDYSMVRGTNYSQLPLNFSLN